MIYTILSILFISAPAVALIKKPLKAPFHFDAAERDDPQTQGALGFCYYAGTWPINEVDLEKAFYWMKRSVESYAKNPIIGGPGKAVTYNNLGFFYKAGMGCDKDYTKALPLLEKSVELGSSPIPCLNLAAMHYGGHGVKASESAAYAHFAKAIERLPQLLDFFDLCTLFDKEKDPKISAFFIKIHNNNSREMQVQEAFTMFKKVLHKGEKVENAFLQVLADVNGWLQFLGEKEPNYQGRKPLEEIFMTAKGLVQEQ